MILFRLGLSIVIVIFILLMSTEVLKLELSISLMNLELFSTFFQARLSKQKMPENIHKKTMIFQQKKSIFYRHDIYRDYQFF